MFRQGDVLMIPVKKSAAVKEADIEQLTDARGVVLAEGETSGHHHQVFGGGAKLFRFKDGRNDRLLTITGDADVRVVGGGSGGVDRHTPISLKEGQYLVRVQRSWTSENASRQVED